MPITIKKYKFFIKKMEFIKFIIKLRKLQIDLKKVKCIVNWKDLKTIIQIKLFLGFANYYRWFIT